MAETFLRSIFRRWWPTAPAEEPRAPEAPTFLRFALQRLRLIPTEPGPANPKKKLVFLAELASLGYAVDNPESFSDAVLEQHSGIMRTLKAMRGGNVDYVPLFQGFPNEVPEENAYFVDRLLGFVGNQCQLWEQAPGVRILDSGAIVPEWLFDVRQFGADPITQLQDRGLFRAGAERQAGRAGDTRIEWVHLRLSGPEELEERARGFLRDNLYARSSIQESLRGDLELLLNSFPPCDIDPARVVFKETRTYLMKFYWERDDFQALQAYCDTPTDLLRLMAALTGGDVSLAQPIKYPSLKRRQRRFILERLEECANLAEDLRRYRGLWLALGRGLHPGLPPAPQAPSPRYPRTRDAFDLLRNGKIITFNAKVEAALDRRDAPAALTLLLDRPGVLARRLHQLLEIAGDQSPQVLQAFTAVAPGLPLKNLLVLESYFSTIEDSLYRSVINKKGKIRVLRNRLRRLRPGVAEEIWTILDQAILEHVSSNKPSWQGKKVWLDERLRKYTVPLQQRKASEGMLVLGRGSKVPLDSGKVLRLFVYWRQTSQDTDLDLSVIQFGPELNYLGHVSWTRLKGDGIVHSGDIQSAPQGAAEFIDLDLGHLAKMKGCRYIAPQVYRYRGEQFGSMTCHSGWMLRDKVDGDYKSFDIKTVANKFDLTGASAYCIPMIIDLWEHEITFVDLYVGNVSPHNTAEKACEDISLITGEMVRMLKTRPNMWDLARYNALGRGATLTLDRSEADLTIGVGDCDYSVDRVERILSELI